MEKGRVSQSIASRATGEHAKTHSPLHRPAKEVIIRHTKQPGVDYSVLLMKLTSQSPIYAALGLYTVDSPLVSENYVFACVRSRWEFIIIINTYWRLNEPSLALQRRTLRRCFHPSKSCVKNSKVCLLTRLL